MADYTPVYSGGATPFTATTSAAVTGGQVLEATTTDAVGPAGAASAKVVGVAAHDAVSGARVTVWPLSNAVHEVTTPAGVTVGDVLAAAAAGTVDTLAPSGAAYVQAEANAYRTVVGVALTTAAAGDKTRFVGR